jgi:hypothetical protein
MEKRTMAKTPDHITITVDEVALRAQIDRIVQESTREASMALRRAADALDPNFMDRFLAANKAWWREDWEKEAAGSKDV